MKQHKNNVDTDNYSLKTAINGIIIQKNGDDIGRHLITTTQHKAKFSP